MESHQDPYNEEKKYYIDFFHKTLTWNCPLVRHWSFSIINGMGKVGTVIFSPRRRVYAQSSWFEAESNKFPVSFKITFKESATSDHIAYSTALVILCTIHF